MGKKAFFLAKKKLFIGKIKLALKKRICQVLSLVSSNVHSGNIDFTETDRRRTEATIA